MKLTRRQLIFGAAGTACLIPVAYALRVSFGEYSYAKSLKHLSAKEAQILLALGEAVIPDTNAFGVNVRDAGVVEGVDDLLDLSSELERTEIHLLLWVVEHVLPAFRGYFTKFTKLSVESRTKILEMLGNSGRSLPTLLVRAVKTLVCFPYFNSPVMREKLELSIWCGP